MIFADISTFRKPYMYAAPSIQLHLFHIISFFLTCIMRSKRDPCICLSCSGILGDLLIVIITS